MVVGAKNYSGPLVWEFLGDRAENDEPKDRALLEVQCRIKASGATFIIADGFPISLQLYIHQEQDE